MNDSVYICDYAGCKKYLEEPINLPCGDMVCKVHVGDSDRPRTFQCPVCSEMFIVPEGGFKVNKKMNAILVENSHLTGKHKKVKDLFGKLENEIDALQKSNLAQPQLFIREFFSGIRRNIELHREQMLGSISKRSKEILDKLNEVESECCRNEQKGDLLFSREDELSELRQKLRACNLKENELDDMNSKIDTKLKEVKNKSASIESSILMNNSIKFEPKDSKEFGSLSVLKLDPLSNQLMQRVDPVKQVQILEGHTDWVNCIEQIGDFDKVITGSRDSSIRVWSGESGKCVQISKQHTKSVEALIISHDKKYLISGSLDKSVKVWNIEQDLFKFVQTLPQEKSVTSLCLLPQNVLVCGLENGKITKWNFNSFIKIDSFRAHESPVNSLKHGKSSQLFSCSADTTIKLWNFEMNQCLMMFVGHTDRVKCLEISDDKLTLYSGGQDRTFRVWDVTSGHCLKIFDLGSFVLCCRFLSPNLIAVGLLNTNQELKLIDLNSYIIVKSLSFPSDITRSLNFNSEKKILLVGSTNGLVRMWKF